MGEHCGPRLGKSLSGVGYREVNGVEWTLNAAKELVSWDVKLGGLPPDSMPDTTSWQSSFNRCKLIACFIFSITQFAHLSRQTYSYAIVARMYHNVAPAVSMAMWEDANV